MQPSPQPSSVLRLSTVRPAAARLTSWATVVAACMCLLGCPQKKQTPPPEPKLVTTGGAITMPDVVQGEEAKTHRFLVRNLGQGDMELRSIELEGDAFHMQVSPALPTTLKAYKFATVLVSYGEHVREGVHTGELVIDTNAQDTPLRVPVKGKVLSPLVCESTNPCLDSRYDPNTKRCVTELLEGSCDDDNACTTDDKCITGMCMGLPITRGRCAKQVCVPGECDDAMVPSALLDKKGRLRKDWRKVFRRL